MIILVFPFQYYSTAFVDVNFKYQTFSRELAINKQADPQNDKPAEKHETFSDSVTFFLSFHTNSQRYKTISSPHFMNC